MKAITVTVQIQLLIKEGGNDLTEVQDTLEVMNNIVGASELEAEPKIFISDISASDIIDVEEEE